MSITLKVNKAIGGKNEGDIITLATDIYGNILDSFWFRRYEDAKIDNCVEVYEAPAPVISNKTVIEGAE